MKPHRWKLVSSSKMDDGVLRIHSWVWECRRCKLEITVYGLKRRPKVGALIHMNGENFTLTKDCGDRMVAKIMEE
jgi:hypothetical protein